MTLQLVEPIIVALKARLADPGAAGLAAAVTAVDATLPAPVDILDYVPPAGLVYNYPTVAIGHGRGIFEDDSGWSATGQYDLMVVCFLQNSDPQALATQMRRYILAAARCTLAGRRLSGTTAEWLVQLRWIDYGEALPERPVPADQPPHAFVAFGGLGIQVRQDED